MTVPASAAQQRLWFLYQLNRADTSYNIPQVYRLRGRLNPDALQESLNRIVARHESLRTTFAVSEHLPIQIIHDSLAIDLPVVEFSSDSVNPTDAEILATINEEIRRPFDLETGPLIRAALYRIAADDHVLLIIEHHIVFDRTSEGLLLKELTLLYKHYDGGDQEAVSLLPELPVQYAAYTQWRVEKNQDEALAPQLKYWREKLAGIRPLELPTDHLRSQSVSNKGERLYLTLPASIVDGMEAVARKNGATTFMGLLAAFNVLLHQWTGSSDITVGTPFADRRLHGTKELLGFFVNNIVLRTAVPDDSDFLELLAGVRKGCFAAYRHNSVPFEKLVEELRPERHKNRNPLFDVQFAFQKLHSDPLDLGDTSTSLLTPSKGTSQYDLTFTVREQPVGYDARVEYRTDLFDAATMYRLMSRFSDLLEIIVNNPSRKLSEIPLLNEEEHARITRDWNQTVMDYSRDKSIHELFEEQARRTPAAIAVTSGDESISYIDLDIRANRLANLLVSRGFGPEKIAAICVERSVDMVIGLFAILKAGGAYLPLDRAYPNNRLTHMLDDSGATILLTHSALLGDLPDTDAQRVLIDTDALAIERAGNTPPTQAVAGNNLAYVIYTSGSTGLPKGVQIEHGNVVNFLYSMKEKPGLNSDDVLLAVTTLSFDIAVLEIFLPLIVGARTIIAGHDTVVDGNELAETIQREHVTIMQATPVTWRMLVEAGWKGSSSFKILCGGEAMPRELAHDLLNRSGELWNMYGPTETTVWSSCYPVADANAPLLIGRPIGNTSIYVLDSEMRPVPVGSMGELFIGGDGVTRGYLHRPELTSERFVASPFDEDPDARLYATGDGVRYLPDGNIEYLNRLDNQVKVRGNRIELGEIQAVIVASSDIKQAVVIVREDEPGDARIAAYFVIEEGCSISGNDIRGTLRESLPAYMIPQYFVELDGLPLTPNGKIDRNALPAPDLDLLAKTDGYRAPRSESEVALASIWQELLGLERVGVHDNFIEMGGHSLLALQAISRIKQEHDVSVSAMSMIMDTLEQIAAQLGGDGPGEEDVANTDAQVNNVRPLYFGPDETLFGLLHEPQGDAIRDSCILLCGPVYIESITAHWAMRRLADQLSRLGYHVLRFDYFGSGDSMGENHEGSVSRWMADVRAAAHEILRLSGCERLSIVGLRFGATLAAMSDVAGVDDLVLWDPVTSGKEYMNYMLDSHRSLIEVCDARRVKPVTEGEYELLGYFCPPESRNGIEASRMADATGHGLERVAVVVHEYTAEHERFERSVAGRGKFVSRHIVDDARCEISDRGKLEAFLPGTSLRVIASIFSEQGT